MRRAPIWMVAVALISIFSTQISFAAITPGSKCTKVGVTSISGGKKYMCVKSGATLVWSKGTVVSYPEGSGNPNPPTYPETTSSRYIQKLIDTTKLSNTTNKTNVDLIVEPSKSNNGPYVKIALDGVNTAINFYSALGMNIPLTDLPIVLGRSQAWSRKTINEYLPDQNLGDQPLQGGFTIGGKLIYTNLVNGTIHTNNPPDNSDLSHVIEPSDWAADIAHETFHVFQGSAPTKLYETFPIWMSEGSAQLFGYMTAAKMSKGKISYNQEVQKYLDWQHDTQKDCSGPIEEMQPPCNYTQGLFVVEYFVSKYGIAGLEKLMHKSAGANFAEQFLNATGESLDKFLLSANQQLKLRGWRNNVQPNPANQSNSQNGSQGGSQTPTPLASELTLPTNLTASQDQKMVTLKWDPAPVGKIAIEFYRIHGDCVQANVSCGSLETDVWPISGDTALPTFFQFLKIRLSDVSAPRSWKFEIYSGNNGYGIWTPSGNPVTLYVSETPISNKLPIPTGLSILEDSQTLTLKWDPVAQGYEPVDFFRILGQCIESNKSCGVFEHDVWPENTGGEPPTFYQIKKSELSKVSKSKTWKFEIYAGNNYYQIFSSASKPLQITMSES